MRDNIKPIEAGFFKYCMKNLNHKDDGIYDDIKTRDGKFMWDLMNEYSDKKNIPFKVLYCIVNKWDMKGIFSWEGDIWGNFHPFKFPMEYIMLIPRRILRKVPAFGMLLSCGEKSLDYATAFTFKTLANGLKDVNAIKENRIDYWTSPSNIPEKYSAALLLINKIVDGESSYTPAFLSAIAMYAIQSYPLLSFSFDSHCANYTASTLRKLETFIKSGEMIHNDDDYFVYSQLASEISNFLSYLFDVLNCK